MTQPRCRGITQDGTRCQNRGRCPHHPGGRARTPKPQRIDPTILTVGQYDIYNPRASRSKVKDRRSPAQQRWQSPPWDMTDGDRVDAQIDELHRGSAELSDALDQGLGQFFRTLFRRKG